MEEALLDDYFRDEVMKRRKQERWDDGYASNDYDDYSPSPEEVEGEKREVRLWVHEEPPLTSL